MQGSARSTHVSSAGCSHQVETDVPGVCVRSASNLSSTTAAPSDPYEARELDVAIKTQRQKLMSVLQHGFDL